MKEFTINMRKDGSAVIAKNYWNPDKSFKAMEEKPFLFEVGMKVVDPWCNIVTIKEVLKHPPSAPGRCPQWNLLIEENNNCYLYTEIAGIFVKEITKEEVNNLLKI